MSRPNFTGTWKFDRARSSLQITPPDSTVFVIKHADPAFQLDRTHIIAGKPDLITLNLTTDGMEKSIVLGDLIVRARCIWEDETLVFDSHFIRGREEATNVVRYSLGDSTGAIVARERFRSKDLNYDNVWVMERE